MEVLHSVKIARLPVTKNNTLLTVGASSPRSVYQNPGQYVGFPTVAELLLKDA